MIEAKERAILFKNELKKLLKKYKTEIEMEEISRGYQGCEYTIKVYLQAEYNKDYELVAESTEIDLGTYFTYIVGCSFSIGFAQYIAEEHYRLVNVEDGKYYWGNEESYKTSEQLLKDYKETLT